jgi:hypothetical protein
MIGLLQTHHEMGHYNAKSLHWLINLYVDILFYNRLRWSRGSVLAFWYPRSRVQTRPKPSDFLGEKNLSTPSFGGEVKPSVPCRRSAACKKSLNLRGSRNLGKITGIISRPQFHLSLVGSLASLRTYRHLAVKVGTSKGGGKQRQTTLKNVPRMQCARAIPVTWLGSGSCQPGLYGWILTN